MGSGSTSTTRRPSDLSPSRYRPYVSAARTSRRKARTRRAWCRAAFCASYALGVMRACPGSWPDHVGEDRAPGCPGVPRWNLALDCSNSASTIGRLPRWTRGQIRFPIDPSTKDVPGVHHLAGFIVLVHQAQAPGRRRRACRRASMPRSCSMTKPTRSMGSARRREISSASLTPARHMSSTAR
jgi:hypothetical protein